jgi:hypothetical protein
MTYEEWPAQMPDSLKEDPIWKFEAYLKALLLYDLAWEDTDKLLKDVRGRKLSGQLPVRAGTTRHAGCSPLNSSGIASPCATRSLPSSSSLSSNVAPGGVSSSPVYPFSFLILDFSFCGKEASENARKGQCRYYRRR